MAEKKDEHTAHSLASKIAKALLKATGKYEQAQSQPKTESPHAKRTTTSPQFRSPAQKYRIGPKQIKAQIEQITLVRKTVSR
jgi:hypothetical protein